MGKGKFTITDETVDQVITELYNHVNSDDIAHSVGHEIGIKKNRGEIFINGSSLNTTNYIVDQIIEAQKNKPHNKNDISNFISKELLKDLTAEMVDYSYDLGAYKPNGKNNDEAYQDKVSDNIYTMLEVGINGKELSRQEDYPRHVSQMLNEPSLKINLNLRDETAGKDKPAEKDKVPAVKNKAGTIKNKTINASDNKFQNLLESENKENRTPKNTNRNLPGH
jgi:hypothetical protein